MSTKPSTRERILNAALQILETDGVRGFSQQAVAKLCGMSQGQLTYHFQKRSDLVMALTESALERVAEYLWERHPDLASKSFEKLLDLVLDLMRSKTRVRALLGLVVEADENEEIRAQLIAQANKVRTLVATALKLDPNSAEVTMTHATLLGYALMFFVQNEKSDQEKLLKDFRASVNVLMKHLEKKPAAKRKKKK